MDQPGRFLSLLDKSGLLAALFPGLYQWIYENNSRLALLQANLESLDQLYRNGTPPSLALFLAALFGPYLEEEALARTRDGIPRPLALDATCANFMEEIRKTVCIPGRVGSQLRAILALQPSLHKMPPRRPSSIVSRPEFAGALAYLRLMSETRRENQASLEWWDAFLSAAPFRSYRKNHQPMKSLKENEEGDGESVSAPLNLICDLLRE